MIHRDGAVRKYGIVLEPSRSPIPFIFIKCSIGLPLVGYCFHLSSAQIVLPRRECCCRES